MCRCNNKAPAMPITTATEKARDEQILEDRKILLAKTYPTKPNPTPDPDTDINKDTNNEPLL